MIDALQPAAAIRVFPDGRMTCRDACRYLGLSYKSLATHRCAGIGPAYVKLGKAVFYEKDELDRWIQSRRVTSTAELRARRNAA